MSKLFGPKFKDCRIDPSHGRMHAKGLCGPCYQKSLRGTLPAALDSTLDDTVRATRPEEWAAREAQAQPTKSRLSVARGIVERYLSAPERVGRVVERFFQRALANDRVLIEYLRLIMPPGLLQPQVQVIINAQDIVKKEGATYDITGEELPPSSEESS